MKHAAVILALVGSAAAVLAQAPVESAVAFEVASVKPTATTAITGPASASSVRVSPSGLVTITNHSLRRLITLAYGIEPAYERYSPEGGPATVLSSRFDVAARMPTDAATPGASATETTLRSTAQMMLRSLLADRFGLRVRSEARQVPVYALTVARQGRLGPELRPSRHDCATFRQMQRSGSDAEPPRDARNRPLCGQDIIRDPTTLNAHGIGQIVAQRDRQAGPLSRLVQGMQGFVDRPLVDTTGLTGQFEWQLEAPMPTAGPAYPSFFSAVREQLGLSIEARTASVTIIVIDAVSLPTSD
jgi:uncharacterized protein (TIGR03435 family)